MVSSFIYWWRPL